MPISGGVETAKQYLFIFLSFVHSFDLKRSRSSQICVRVAFGDNSNFFGYLQSRFTAVHRMMDVCERFIISVLKQAWLKIGKIFLLIGFVTTKFHQIPQISLKLPAFSMSSYPHGNFNHYSKFLIKFSSSMSDYIPKLCKPNGLISVMNKIALLVHTPFLLQKLLSEFKKSFMFACASQKTQFSSYLPTGMVSIGISHFSPSFDIKN